MKHFLIDKNYGAYLSTKGFPLPELLKRAELPQDFFARQMPSLTAEEYFRFVQAVDALSPSLQTPVQLAAGEGIEAFTPPVFAAYCSPNALVCLRQLAQYKPLIGPLLYEVTETETEVRLTLYAEGVSCELPEILVGMEFCFLVGLLRKAAKAPITPQSATARFSVQNSAYADFIGVPITDGSHNQLVFPRADVLLPFASRNESMWAFFEPELKRRLAMTETDDSFAARVRSTLMELLPRGACSIEDTAKVLGYSCRSLQRRLQEEGTSFQKQLNHARELLAKSHLATTDLSAADIAFLLGYQETGSFLRVFTGWTGMTPRTYRDTHKA